VSVARFSAPTRIIAGLGARAELVRVLERIGAWPAAVVVDRGVHDSGVLERLFDDDPSRFVLCEGVDADPTVADAEGAARHAQAAGCQAVLAVGGGSALGVGKAVALRLNNPEPISAYAGRDRAPNRPAPCVAVPTIAGSGSEVSNALVLYDADGDRVTVVRGDGYEPDVAILDGELLATLPDVPMLHAALDGLSHALEALWARGASRYTDALAHAAAAEIAAVLPAALAGRRPADIQRLLEATTMANLACGPSGLGLAHALASATSVRLPHGYQTAVLLPHVAAFNAPVLDAAGAATVAVGLDVYDAIGFAGCFVDGEVTAVAAEAMVAAALGNPFRTNNLRLAERDELRAILAAAGAEVAETTLRSTT
jgi:alcohol dehydrogenase class IV